MSVLQKQDAVEEKEGKVRDVVLNIRDLIKRRV
jgi:hypothetical protein